MPVIHSPASKPITEAAASTRILLCEGYDEALVPESAYVVQGKKVWQAFGESTAVKSLCESDQGMTLVESFEGLDLVEDGHGGKKLNGGAWIVEGPAQRSDVRNKNGRSYPRAIWEKWIGKADSPLQETIKARGAIGHLEHPKDGRTDGREGALVVTEAVLKKDGVVWCKFEVLDTPHGKVIQEYIKKKVRWGVSSRGAGTVNEAGVVSITDYVPETWDAVMRPSTPGAYPLPEQTKTATKKVVSEGEKTTDVSEKSGASMTDVQKVYKDRLSAINRMVDTVEECAVAATEAEKVLTDLAESITKGELDLTSGTPLMIESASVLREAFDALAAIKVIEQAGNGVQPGQGAFNTVVAMLKKQVSEAVSEIGVLQAKVEKAEAVAERMSAARIKVVEERDAANAVVESLKGQLDSACTTISDLSESTAAPSPVDEAVDLLVTKYPVLNDYASTLREVADIRAVVEGVVPILLRESRVSVSQNSAKPAAPVGLVLESEAVPVPVSTPKVMVPPPFQAQVGLVAAMIGKRTVAKQ